MNTTARDANHWSTIGENTFVLGIRFLAAVHRYAGRWLFLACLAPVVSFYWASNGRARRASLDYLRRLEAATGALGRAPRAADSWRHLFLFATTLLDQLLAVGGRYPLERVAVFGEEAVEAYLAGGRGAVIVTAHTGCLEMCRVLARRNPRLRLTILVHTRHAEQFNRMLERLDPTRPERLVEVSEIGPATAVELERRIDAGELVVIAGDRVPLAGGRTVTVPFLGAPARFPVGPYVLASLLRCPLYLLTCHHAGAGYRIETTLLAERVALPRGEREAAFARHAAAYAAALGSLLAQSPFDWFNFHLFWEPPA